MKRVTTIICSIAFVIAGILLVQSKNEMNWSYKAANAATLPGYTNPAQLPYDLSLGHTNNVQTNTVDTIRDTVHFNVYDVTCVGKRKIKVATPKWAQKKVMTTPDTIPSQAKIDVDTLYVSKPVILIPKKDTTTIAK